MNAPLANGWVVHHTRGLMPFIGHELAIEISAEDHVIDSLNTLVAIAGYALVLGPAYRLRTISNAAGQVAHLTQASYPEIESDMVKIEF